MTEISVSEWIKELERVIKEGSCEGVGDPGLTAEEITEALNMPVSKVHRELRRAARNGLVLVGWQKRRIITGIIRSTPVYRLAESKPKPKPKTQAKVNPRAKAKPKSKPRQKR